MIGSHPVEAASAFEQALALDPNCYEANQLFAEFCVTKGDFERAAQHYLRAIREEQSESGLPWRTWLIAHWGKAALATVVILIAASIDYRPKHDNIAAVDPIDQAAQEVASSPDFSVIDNLDTLLALEDNDVWLAGSTH